MISLGFVLVIVNFVFLFLGAILFIYASKNGINIIETSDDIYPSVALKYLGPVTGVIFLIGLLSAAYSSADSALTSLTTSFNVDFLNINKRNDLSVKQKTRIRKIVHTILAVFLVFVIIGFKND